MYILIYLYDVRLYIQLRFFIICTFSVINIKTVKINNINFYKKYLDFYTNLWWFFFFLLNIYVILSCYQLFIKRLYLHAFIIIPPLIIRKSRELTIENKPPGGFTPPSWASEKRKMDEKLSGQLRRLNPERSKSRKPMAAINSSQKSLPCVQESKLIRTRNQLLSFPLLSFFFFLSSFKRTLLAYSLSPSETYAHLLSFSVI